MIEKAEIVTFLKLFIHDGYVLDFTTADFDLFTAECVGIPLCSHYGQSKGASLTSYCYEAEENDVLKLLSALLEHYENHGLSYESDSAQLKRYEKCRRAIDRESGNIRIETPAIQELNRSYIQDIALRANKDVDEGNYDSAITKSRTLLEEVFCHAIEAKNVIPSDKGDIYRLYGQVKDLYNMHASKEMDVRINSLLSGLEKLLKAIAEMRNEGSDSHGIGSRRVAIRDYHARLFVNSALTMADFILSVEQYANKQ